MLEKRENKESRCFWANFFEVAIFLEQKILQTTLFILLWTKFSTHSMVKGRQDQRLASKRYRWIKRQIIQQWYCQSVYLERMHYELFRYGMAEDVDPILFVLL